MATIQDVIATQQQISAAIETLYTNFKKDGAERKTPEYLKRKLDLLDNYWFEYQSNFDKLTSAAELDAGTRDYLNKDKDRVGERYHNVRAHIQSYQPEERTRTPILKPSSFAFKQNESHQEMETNTTPGPQGSSSSGHVSSGTVSKTEEMLRKQNSNFKAFHRTVKGINLDLISERWEYEDQLRNVQSRWATIDALHWELDSQLDGSHQDYEETFSNYEAKYNNIKKAINQKIWSTVHMEKSTPQMEIPTFSGNYNNWISFKDLFSEVIHNNNSMSKAQKMQYLKTKVKGEAERLIQHLHVSSDNYNICWDILNQRYNNQRLIFTSHMNILSNLPIMQNPSLALIKRIHDTTLECTNAIKNLGIDISTWDPILVYFLTQKLDADTYSDYMESVKSPRDLPKLKELLDFLEARFTTLESSRRKQDNTQPRQQGTVQNKVQSNNTSNGSQSAAKNNASSAKFKCMVCTSNDHGIYYCKTFLEMSPANRLKTVTKLSLCENCLHDHQGKPCKSNRVCRDCKDEHNSLLHGSFTQSTRSPTQGAFSGSAPAAGRGGNLGDASANLGKQVRSSSHVSLQNEYEVLLPTATIKVQSANGEFYTLRALLDQGSQTSLITENAAQLLKLPRNKCQGIISGIGDKESNCKGMMTLNCCSLVTDFTFKTDVLIMKQLIKSLPSQSLSKPDWSYLKQIELADPEFYKSRPIDILLGADIYSIVLMDGICKVSANLPTAQQTQLGWILSGNVRTFHCNVVLHNMDDIQKFWEIEDIGEKSDLSSEDQQCIEYFQNTTTRKQDGRYEVRLPLKSDFENKLGHSKSKAVAQFYKLERKFAQKPELANDYKQFIQEYLTLGHMTPTADRFETNNLTKCYLPHHCVTRSDSTTTKLRVVFNASEKTSTGISLNDIMCRGPNLQQDLQCLIIKWRQYKYAFTADIEKMFRQIWINPTDQFLQMIMWRDNHYSRLQDYKLATVTYGTKAAPFLAMMTLKQLARDEERNYPDSRAPKVLEESFYMDDLMDGSHSIQSARKLQADMISLLSSGGFHLRKWKSNSADLLEGVQTDNYQCQSNFDFKQAESTKALGLGWNPQQDCFTFQSKIEFATKTPTKRSLLSDISKVFDPLGWLAPLTSKLKILFQDTWKLPLGWDEALPEDICKEWIKIKEDIDIISQFTVPRWLQTELKENITLFGFCDASTKAYASVVYCKVERGSDISVTLVAAKTKLVPLKQTYSIPRLELCGAVLLTRLMSKIQKCLINHNIKVYGWCDSTAVLGWINGDPDQWKSFVANRVKQVTMVMPAACWRYVQSTDNPADCASRGLTASQLKEQVLWWRGPAWLLNYKPETNQGHSYLTDQEVRKPKRVNVTQMSKSDDEIINKVLSKQSSFQTAVRVIAWMLRFGSKNKKPNYLTLQEINRAKLVIINIYQKQHFSEEIDNLIRHKSVSTKSKLYPLNPILDENGVLRVGGRLRHANMDPEMKHPIIILNNTRLADLLIDEAHQLSFHGGTRLTTAFLRRRYWLLGGNNATKKRLRGCVKCKKHSPHNQYQIMGDLPAARSNPSRPFYHCGVDYTGHVNVKANKGRGIKTMKGYVAVFVCMASKAIHLELVSDLTTSSFIAALRRMSARRGVPGHLYSDQGTNFVGADKILRRELLELQQNQDFSAEIVNMGIQWHFNAPSWPSAGGLWEAAVKSLKYHLKRVVGEQNLTYEEFTTLLNQLEGCLNSRPLCTITEDPNDLDFLTPSHFLASGPNLVLYDTEKDLRTRWHLTENIFKNVWSRWREEYLTQLSARSKWRQPQKNICLNDVVIIKDDNLPPGKWPLGRVVELHPGSDGYVRVVTLKTKNGFMKRPVVKLSILPVHKEQDPLEVNQEQKSSPKTKNKTFSFATMAISMLLFLITIPSSAKCSYSTSPLHNNNSLYFDRIANMSLIHDHWRLVVYYDTQAYYEGNKALVKYIKYLDDLCVRIQDISYCNGVTLQLHHEISELQFYNEFLQKHNNIPKRKRRGLINGVGYVANSLFGVLDQRFAEKYEQDIQLIKENENHLASLWKNQTSVVEAELNVLKRTEDVLDKHHKLITKKFNSIETSFNQVRTQMQNISLVYDFITTSMIANNVLLSLKNIQQTLLETITNIYNGKFNFHLIHPNQLWHELSIILEQLPKDLSLPIKKSDSLSEIYNLIQVRARVTDNFVIFELKIPLIGDDLYEILQIIPTPSFIDKKNIQVTVPISKYVAVNLKKDAFIQLNEWDLRSCLDSNNEIKYCQIKRPIYFIQDDNCFCETLPDSRRCKTLIQPCVNTWIELKKLNTYLYNCCDRCQLKLVCGDRITPVKLSQSGFFNVNEGCVIKSADYFIYSHRQEVNFMNASSNIDLQDISQVNHLVNISLPDPFTSVEEKSNVSEFTRQIQDIQQKLDIMKTEQPIIDKVSYHDIHHYAAIYVILACFGISLAVWACKRVSRKTSRACTPPPPPPPPAAWEMPHQAVRPDTTTRFQDTSEMSELSARVFMGNKGTVPSVNSARVSVENNGKRPNFKSVSAGTSQNTGSSPVVFKPIFKVIDE